MTAPTPLGDVRFRVPALWEQDWQAAVATAEEADQEFVLGRARLAHLLRGVDGTRVDAGRLGWMQLWSLHFTLLGEALAALEASTPVTMNVLARTAFEATLCMMAILEPAASGDGPDTVRDRLAAYAAWCLWQDLEASNEALDRRTQYGVWDPRPAQELADELDADPAKRQFYEDTFGPLPDVEPVELSRRRSRAGAEQSDRHQRLRRWLEDPGLDPWRERLAAAKRSGQPIRSYFNLIGTARSVAGQLHHSDMRWAYTGFVRGSRYAHGTSVELFLHTSGDSVAPLLSAPDAVRQGTAGVATLTSTARGSPS